MKKYNLGIVIPTYKEKDNIGDLLKLVYQEVQENKIKTLILIMDDNSPDGTAEIARESAKTLNNEYIEIRVHVRPEKMGLASAYTQGFSMIKDEVEFCLSMDADLSHQPKYIKSLLAKANEGYDLVIGSRYVKGGSVQNWSLFRRILSKGGSIFPQIVLWTKIRDFTGGYNLYRSSIFNKFDLNSVKAQGYLFQIEMKYTIVKKGFKYAEVPIIFPDRVKGQSKMDSSIILEALIGVVKLRLRQF